MTNRETVVISLLAGCTLVGGGGCQSRADWDHSPSGRVAVMDYLAQRGFELHERLLPLDQIGESEARQLVVLPGAQLGPAEWKAVERWVGEDGHALVLAGVRDLPAWVGAQPIQGAAGAGDKLVATSAAGEEWRGLELGVPGGDYVEARVGEVLLTRTARAYAVVRNFSGRGAQNRASLAGHPEGSGHRVLVLADDFLLCNASLLVADNGAALANLLAPGGMRIELAGDTTGLVAANPVESVRRGRLAPALLQLALFLALFFVGNGARFGRPVLSAAPRRREFAEHVRALGLCYERAQAASYALAAWGDYAIERMRERCDRQGDGSLAGLARAVARRTGREADEVMQLFLAVKAARARGSRKASAQDLATAARLHELFAETGGPGGPKRFSSYL